MTTETPVDRFVSQNEALWKFLTQPFLPHKEKMALLLSAFPNSRSLNAETLLSRPVIDLQVKRDIVVEVEQYAPPSMRYSAWDRNSYDGAPDSKSNIIGRGESKQAAIRDLLDRLADKEQP